MFGRKKVIRVALFGGSFNPPTRAHEAMVRHILNKGLADEVLVCPSYSHREKGDQSDSFIDRVNMCTLAFSDVPGVTVSTMDMISSVMFNGEEGTGSTLNLVKTLLSNTRLGCVPRKYHPVMGADCLNSIRQWYRYDGLLHLAGGIIAFQRPGDELDVVTQVFADSAHVKALVPWKMKQSSTAVRQAMAAYQDIKEESEGAKYLHSNAEIDMQACLDHATENVTKRVFDYFRRKELYLDEVI